jgi:internalin A
VRALMVLVLIVGAPLGWVIGSAKIQRNAVAAIRRIDGTIVYNWDWNYEGDYIDRPSLPHWQRWLVAHVGEDYVGHVAAVEFVREMPEDVPIERRLRALTDEALAQLVEFNHIRMLNIRNCRDRDAMLADFKHLNGLTMLNLPCARLTNFKFLKEMTRLRELDLLASSVDDDDLAYLEKLPHLKSLGLWTTGITDAGLVHLKALPALTILGLAYTGITDAGLMHLKGLNRLEGLSLAKTNVTDAGLVHLKGLNRLKGLDLRNTKVTDAGLVHFRQMTGLRNLDLSSTKVTAAGVQSLQSALPMLSVARY